MLLQQYRSVSCSNILYYGTEGLSAYHLHVASVYILSNFSAYNFCGWSERILFWTTMRLWVDLPCASPETLELSFLDDQLRDNLNLDATCHFIAPWCYFPLGVHWRVTVWDRYIFLRILKTVKCLTTQHLAISRRHPNFSTIHTYSPYHVFSGFATGCAQTLAKFPNDSRHFNLV
jgi:hypothetical protein